MPLLGISAYLDHTWNEQFTAPSATPPPRWTTPDGQTTDAYNTGQYASANVLYTPVKDVLIGVELLWGDREDNGGNSGSDTRIQFSFKYNFGTTL